MKGVVVSVVIALASMLPSAFASEMAFKLDRATSVDGQLDWNITSIPYNSYSNAASMWTTLGGSTTFHNLGHWVPVADAWAAYDGTSGDFTITQGEALIMHPKTAGSITTVGVHDRTVSISLVTDGNLKWNMVSVPYHTTAGTAADLWGELSGQGAVPLAIGRWVTAEDRWIYYNGVFGDFQLEPGEGLIIKVQGAVSWTPEHH